MPFPSALVPRHVTAPHFNLNSCNPSSPFKRRETKIAHTGPIICTLLIPNGNSMGSNVCSQIPGSEPHGIRGKCIFQPLFFLKKQIIFMCVSQNKSLQFFPKPNQCIQSIMALYCNVARLRFSKNIVILEYTAMYSITWQYFIFKKKTF